MNPAPRPFICGHPRSGTSLLTAILDRHSQLAMMPETHLLDGLRDEPPASSHAHLLIAAWDRLQARLGDLRLSPADILAEFERHPCRDTGLLLALLDLWARRAGKPYSGEKTPAHLAFVDRILEEIPGSRVVLIIRDGRAVVEAMRRVASHAESTIDLLIERWIRAAERTGRWLDQYPERTMLVRFEDLASDPVNTITPVMAWLGLEFEAGMLQARPTATYRRWETYAKRDAAGPIDPEKANAWRVGDALLTPVQRASLAPHLVRWGYHTEPTPRLAVRPLRQRECVNGPPPEEGAITTGSPPVLLVGGGRSGTAAVAAWLRLHPGIGAPATRERASLVLDWPLRRDEWRALLRPALSNAPQGAVTLSHSASYYLSHPDVPRRAKAILPEARIIVLTRDPVERAFSHWLRSWRIGVERLNFDEALIAEASRLDGIEERLATAETFISFDHIHYAYAQQGRYSTHLQRWLSCFPAEQILVAPVRTLTEDPGRLWRRLCHHCGIAPCEPPAVPDLGGFPWPLSPEAVHRSVGARLIRSALTAEPDRLRELTGGEPDWVGWR